MMGNDNELFFLIVAVTVTECTQKGTPCKIEANIIIIIIIIKNRGKH